MNLIGQSFITNDEISKKYILYHIKKYDENRYNITWINSSGENKSISYYKNTCQGFIDNGDWILYTNYMRTKKLERILK